jgi:hypothetical protein
MSESERPEAEAPAGETKAAEAAPLAAPGRAPGSITWIVGVLAVVVAGFALWLVLGSLQSGRAPDFWAAPVATDGAAAEKQLQSLAERLNGIAGDSEAAASLARALEKRLGTFDERLAELADADRRLAEQIASAAEAEGAGGADLAALADRIARAEAGLEAARAKAAAADVEPALAALRDELATLKARLDALETSLASAPSQGRRQALVLAVGQLGVAVAAGRPYRAELDRLAPFAGEDNEIKTALEVLKASAAEGLASPAALRRSFRPLAGAILRAGQAPPPEGWLARTGKRLTSLVTIRRTGDFEGSDENAVVNRAERSLAEGDLQAAERALAELQGAAAEVTADWRRAAAARIAADRAIRRLEARAIELLGAG